MDRRQATKQRTFELTEIVRQIERFLLREQSVAQADTLILEVSKNSDGLFTGLVRKGRTERLL